jgi:hypothetical protein
MALLIYEIWRDEADEEQFLAEVTPQGDKVRAATLPQAVLVHSFAAASDFQAFQKNYDWNGWGQWKPETDWTERYFTDAEAEAQRRYLAERNVR